MIVVSADMLDSIMYIDRMIVRVNYLALSASLFLVETQEESNRIHMYS